MTWETRSVGVKFTVHAKATEGFSAKHIASYLINWVQRIFGGHPSQAATLPALHYGRVLWARYVRDIGIQTEYFHHQWQLELEYLVDVPVRKPL